jgi:hypothetical protein
MGGLLIDREMTQGFLRIASAILSNHFYYDYDSLERFCQTFTSNINYEHTLLQATADDEFKYIIWGDKGKKAEFTARFVGYFLCQTLYEINFSDREIDCFENILIKYIRVCEIDDFK